MTLLIDQERRDVWRDIMQRVSGDRAALDISKLDLRAAIDAIDGWLDANGPSLNLAIPLPARTALTAVQKRQLFLFVVQARFRNGV